MFHLAQRGFVTNRLVVLPRGEFWIYFGALVFEGSWVEQSSQDEGAIASVAQCLLVREGCTYRGLMRFDIQAAQQGVTDPGRP